MNRYMILLVVSGCTLLALIGGTFVRDASTQGLLTTVYVDVNSTSGTEDGSQQNPFKSIAGGLAAAASDADIYVAQGTYAEMVTITNSVHLHGTSSVSTVVTGNPDETWIVRFDASGSMDNLRITTDASLSADSTTDLPVGVSIGSAATNVTVSSCSVDRTQVGIEASNTASSITIANNTVTNSYIGVGLVAVTGAVNLSSNTLTNNTVAVYSTGSSPLLAGNLVASNDVGVRIATRGETSGSSVAVLQGNTISGNTRRGVWFDQGSSSITTVLDIGGGGYSTGQNTIRDNGEYDVYNEAHEAISAKYNSWHNRILGKAFDDADILTD